MFAVCGARWRWRLLHPPATSLHCYLHCYIPALEINGVHHGYGLVPGSDPGAHGPDLHRTLVLSACWLTPASTTPATPHTIVGQVTSSVATSVGLAKGLVFLLLLHSVFEGLAVELLEDGWEVLEICLVLIIHKSIIAFNLAFKLWQGRSVVGGCVLMFVAMPPLGIGVGMGLMETKGSPQHQLTGSKLQGMAIRTFIYITVIEVLSQERHSADNCIPRVAPWALL